MNSVINICKYASCTCSFIIFLSFVCTPPKNKKSWHDRQKLNCRNNRHYCMKTKTILVYVSKFDKLKKKTNFAINNEMENPYTQKEKPKTYKSNVNICQWNIRFRFVLYRHFANQLRSWQTNDRSHINTVLWKHFSNYFKFNILIYKFLDSHIIGGLYDLIDVAKWALWII